MHSSLDKLVFNLCHCTNIGAHSFQTTSIICKISRLMFYLHFQTHCSSTKVLYNVIYHHTLFCFVSPFDSLAGDKSWVGSSFSVHNHLGCDIWVTSNYHLFNGYVIWAIGFRNLSSYDVFYILILPCGWRILNCDMKKLIFNLYCIVKCVVFIWNDTGIDHITFVN